MENHINDELDPSSSDKESDNGADNESDSGSVIMDVIINLLKIKIVF